MTRSESLSAESRSVQNSPGYRLMKSRSESDLSQPESDEESYSLSGRRNVDLDLAFSHKKRGYVVVHVLLCVCLWFLWAQFICFFWGVSAPNAGGATSK
uniref:Uncharacterized protein n=1 Tax=Cyprinodon variegatus TaxID=28743 RepID=A0A3Q2DIU1_CYPVA